MSSIDKRTAERIRDPDGDRLIRMASRSLADFVAGIGSLRGGAKRHVAVFFGGGNNGADALMAGRLLEEQGFATSYFSAVNPGKGYRGFVRRYVERLDAANVHHWRFDSAESCNLYPALLLPGDCIVIDGILGVGISSAPDEYAAALIGLVNRIRAARNATVVSVDVPSGLNATTGEAEGAIVRADATVCMGMPKTGLRSDFARAHTGPVMFADIGVSDEDIGDEDSGGGVAIFTERDFARVAPRRAFDANKGDFGSVLVVGGCGAYRGAPALASLGALHGGAGLVTAVVPQAAAHAVAAAAPEVIIRTMPANGDAEWDAGALAQIDFAGKTLVAGPGIGRTGGAKKCVERLLFESGAKAAVLDADGLNAFENDAEKLARAKMPLVITPHPGEAARLLGATARDVQSDREGAAKKLAETTGAVVVLKGAGTLISSGGHATNLIARGNPAMATPGMGDVLAGLVGAMLANGLAPFDAARCASFRHAAAGDAIALAPPRPAVVTASHVARSL